jgi:hypothetical protein
MLPSSMAANLVVLSEPEFRQYSACQRPTGTFLATLLAKG